MGLTGKEIDLLVDHPFLRDCQELCRSWEFGDDDSGDFCVLTCCTDGTSFSSDDPTEQSLAHQLTASLIALGITPFDEADARDVTEGVRR